MLCKKVTMARYRYPALIGACVYNLRPIEVFRQNKVNFSTRLQSKPQAYDGSLDNFGFSGQAALYAEFRPTYPAALIDAINDIPLPSEDFYLDACCGSGQLLCKLAPRFMRALGVDRLCEITFAPSARSHDFLCLLQIPCTTRSTHFPIPECHDSSRFCNFASSAQQQRTSSYCRARPALAGTIHILCRISPGSCSRWGPCNRGLWNVSNPWRASGASCPPTPLRGSTGIP